MRQIFARRKSSPMRANGHAAGSPMANEPETVLSDMKKRQAYAPGAGIIKKGKYRIQSKKHCENRSAFPFLTV